MANWQVGDLALCMRGSTPCADCGRVFDQVAGRVYTVSRVYNNDYGLALEFAELPAGDFPCDSFSVHSGYDAAHFRKITPPRADAFDREVIEAMRGEPVEAA